jgi:hypothetical protein
MSDLPIGKLDQKAYEEIVDALLVRLVTRYRKLERHAGATLRHPDTNFCLRFSVNPHGDEARLVISQSFWPLFAVPVMGSAWCPLNEPGLEAWLSQLIEAVYGDLLTTTEEMGRGTQLDAAPSLD